MAFLFFKNSKENNEDNKKQVEVALHKTKEGLGSKILNIFNRSKISDDFYSEVEEILITSDVGVDVTLDVIKLLKSTVQRSKVDNEEEFKTVFRDVLKEIIPEIGYEYEENKLNIIFILGVNGVGKTTSIAKLANLFKSQNKKVIVAACDTFRAAAIEQLEEWCNRIDVPVIKHAQGSDPGAVLYDAIDASVARKSNFLIVDTAGRLHNKDNLMEELNKLNKILDRKTSECYRQNFLVLDAGTGQNALMQSQTFNSVVKVDGIILTKLDSTAKGGIVITLANKTKIPVKFIGVGEKINNLLPFNREDYISSLI